mmetsp:Transcript_1310/g.2300  ORF Transcript_1310/g.2300 Transcript_1310/m.2300 type:complete len:81 (+) Transcript_1310:478-720(+)
MMNFLSTHSKIFSHGLVKFGGTSEALNFLTRACEIWRRFTSSQAASLFAGRKANPDVQKFWVKLLFLALQVLSSTRCDQE